MRALRLLMVWCLLVVLPLAGIAAPLDCCPPETTSGHPPATETGDELHHAHANHAPVTPNTADTDCADRLCALHCAHAPTLTSPTIPLPLVSAGRRSFAVPPEHAALAAAQPNFRPPIFAHC